MTTRGLAAAPKNPPMNTDTPSPPLPDEEESIRENLDWCYASVQEVSRTFAITIDILNEPMSTYTCVGYLLCRVPDTIEDSNHISSETKANLLRLYDDVLSPSSDTTATEFVQAVKPHVPDAAFADEPQNVDWDWRVTAEAERVFEVYESFDVDDRDDMRPPIRELTQGMADFVSRHVETPGEGLRVETVEELEEYCYYVAGTVGHLITNLGFGSAAGGREEVQEIAEGFGTLLQLVNISKDVYDDYHSEDNVYLPRDWLEEEGVSDQSRLLAEENRDGTARVVERVANHARSFRGHARAYLNSLIATNDETALAAWGIPYLLSIATLREVTNDPTLALEDTPAKVTRDEVYAVIDAMTNGEADLDELESTITEEPLHTA